MNRFISTFLRVHLHLDGDDGFMGVTYSEMDRLFFSNGQQLTSAEFHGYCILFE